MNKRCVCFLIAFIALFSGITGRLSQLSLGENSYVDKGYNSYSLHISAKHCNVYYRDMSLATNNKKCYVAVIRPNSKDVEEAKRLLAPEEYQLLLNEISKGYPVCFQLEKFPSVNLYNIHVYDYLSTENNCYQLLNASSNGLLKHCNYIIGERKLSFAVDAKGRLLDGDEGILYDDNYDSLKGVKISIDKHIQDVVLDASSKIKNGSVVVMKVKDSSILACVNKPLDNFNLKALMNYSVGSVFKLVVCACALENNIQLLYRCSGSIEVGDTTFSCQSNHVHNNENLEQALANSCNCYFVNLALTLGKDKLMKTAEDLGFMEKTKFADGWEFENSKFPSSATLESKGQLALLGFGQGQLLVTPLQMCSVICTIANKGLYSSPRLILSEVMENGVSINKLPNKQKQVLSEKTCDNLIGYMRSVVTDGTGKNAEDKNKQSAGKTATAQTGQYIYGREIMNTWFAGLYPYDEPEYAIVILNEDGTSGSKDCCPVFRTIVENLS